MHIANHAACVSVDLDSDILAVVEPFTAVCLRTKDHQKIALDSDRRFVIE